MKKILFLVSCILASSAVVGFLFYFGYLRFNYVDVAEFPVQGLDVSHHQGSIDWEKVGRGNFRFAFIKATEGGSHVDSRFRFNWVNARKNGLCVGAYHFFTFKKSGREQARNFVAAVPRDNASLPPVVDLEFMGNGGNRLSGKELLVRLSDFLHVVENHYHKKPILYTTHEFYEYYLAGRFTEYPLWVRDIFRRPRLIDGRTWSFWQYANRARVNGIKKYVDLNAFNGSEREFHKLIDQKL